MSVFVIGISLIQLLVIGLSLIQLIFIVFLSIFIRDERWLNYRRMIDKIIKQPFLAKHLSFAEANIYQFKNKYDCFFHWFDWCLSIWDILFCDVFDRLPVFSSNCKKKYILIKISSSADISWEKYWWSYSLYIYRGSCGMKIRTRHYLWSPVLSLAPRWYLSGTKRRDVIYWWNLRGNYSISTIGLEEAFEFQRSVIDGRSYFRYLTLWYHDRKNR